MRLRLVDIRFKQASIHHTFANGASIYPKNSMPANVEVVQAGGVYWTMNNRSVLFVLYVTFAQFLWIDFPSSAGEEEGKEKETSELLLKVPDFTAVLEKCHAKTRRRNTSTALHSF